MLSDIVGDGVEILVLSLDEDEVAVDLVGKLRDDGVRTQLLMDKSLSKGLEYANGKGVGKVVIVGADEVKAGKFKVKNMRSGVEELLLEKEVLTIGDR